MSIFHKLATFILMFILYHDQIRTAQAQESTPLFLVLHWCSGSNYTVNSTYETNLNILLSSLSTTFRNNKTTIQNGYRNITVGKTSDAVYGSLHCREDIAPAICSACVQGATREVVKNSMCPSSKEAIMYYNGCVLRYSDKYYFSKLDEEPEGVIRFAKIVTNPATYLTLVTRLLDDLVVEVVNNTSSSPSLFATGETNYTRQNKLYGMVQCTPDLTPSICATCLRSAIEQLSDCCYGYQAARILYPSCTFRFETDPFYGQSIYATTPATPPTPPLLTPPTLPANTTTSNGNNTNSLRLGISISIPVGIAVLLSFIVVWWFYFHKKKKINAQDGNPDFQSAESLHFNFDIISTATDNFSEANKLGEGGFGAVYKGTLSDGQEIAVKRLSQDSGQGDQEFKNEVLLLAKLEHKNLVRLLGFCLHGQEKLLVYELMNASLDQFIFDTLKQTYLDWEMRYRIIGGIGRGLLYLHEDSRLKIIHRDLKPSNILLAPDMVPKIADFGTARLFLIDQTHANTNRIAGTYGYMAPEYAFQGQFSVKSDVFSFGVLVLEILSGKKNTSFYGSMNGAAQDLLTCAWGHWQNGSALELLDASIKQNCSRSEVMRCIHIALLCVQHSIADRPTMTTVILMLNSNSVTLPTPTQPGYIVPDQAVEKQWSLNEASFTELSPR